MQTKPSDNQPIAIEPSQDDPAYISDDKEDTDEVQPRHSKRLAQPHMNSNTGPNLIAAAVPDLVIHHERHLTTKYAASLM